MTLNVPFLRKEIIAQKAEDLLTAFAKHQGRIAVPPVPVDEILESHLKISLGFDDLHKRFGVPDVLGAIWIRRREVLVDEQLDPVEKNGVEGRYRFTVGHEIGHWELHRELLADSRQLALPGDIAETPSLVCRKSEAKAPIEWQADRFAADLLMPATLVHQQWQEAVGSAQPLVYDDHKAGRYGRRPYSRGFTSVGTVLRRAGEREHVYFFETVAREFAPKFRVSVQAMRIRLEDLGLLREHRDVTLFA